MHSRLGRGAVVLGATREARDARKCPALVPPYHKFESISLQRRVCELSVPEDHAINPRNNLLRRLAAWTQHEREWNSNHWARERRRASAWPHLWFGGISDGRPHGKNSDRAAACGQLAKPCVPAHGVIRHASQRYDDVLLMCA